MRRRTTAFSPQIAAGEQHDHEHAKCEPVIDEDRCGVSFQVAQQKPYRRVAEHKRDYDRYYDRSPAELREVVALFEKLEKTGRADRWNAQQERISSCGRPIDPAEERRHDRRAASR